MSGYFIYVNGTSSKIRGGYAIETLKTTLCTANRVEHFDKTNNNSIWWLFSPQTTIVRDVLGCQVNADANKIQLLINEYKKQKNKFFFLFSSWQQRLYRPRQFRRAAVQRDGPGRGRQRPARPLVQERIQSSNLHVRT